MMTIMKIYKYKLKITGHQRVVMPLGKILSFAQQGDDLFVWAYINPAHKEHTRNFEIYGTGHPIQEQPDVRREFLGSVHVPERGLVWHLFELHQIANEKQP